MSMVSYTRKVCDAASAGYEGFISKGVMFVLLAWVDGPLVCVSRSRLSNDLFCLRVYCLEVGPAPHCRAICAFCSVFMTHGICEHVCAGLQVFGLEDWSVSLKPKPKQVRRRRKSEDEEMGEKDAAAEEEMEEGDAAAASSTGRKCSEPAAGLISPEENEAIEKEIARSLKSWSFCEKKASERGRASRQTRL